MSSVQLSKLSPQDISQLACTYAALILHDDGQDITANKIGALTKAAGLKIQSYWPRMFAKAIGTHNLATFMNFSGSSAASSGPSETVQPQKEKKDGKKDAPEKKDAPQKKEKQKDKDKDKDKGKGKDKDKQKEKVAPPPPPPKQEQPPKQDQEQMNMGGLFE